MTSIWHAVIIQPLLNSLVLLVSFLPGHSLALAVVALTILVKIILLPLSYAALKTQVAQKKIQPALDAIKKTITDKKEQAQKTLEIYKNAHISPFSSILLILIQLPLVIGLYRVFLGGFSFDSSLLYSFVHIPETLSYSLAGIDLQQKSIFLAILAGITQFIQIHFSPAMKLNRKEKKDRSQQEDMAHAMQRGMKISMPFMIAIFGSLVPGAIALYWITSNIITLVQEMILFKKISQESYERTS